VVLPDGILAVAAGLDQEREIGEYFDRIVCLRV
jgi:hypothetical protein